jgi:hypothetical protein
MNLHLNMKILKIIQCIMLHLWLFLQCCCHVGWSTPSLFDLLHLLLPFLFLYRVVILLWFSRNLSGNHSWNHNSYLFDIPSHNFLSFNILPNFLCYSNPSPTLDMFFFFGRVFGDPLVVSLLLSKTYIITPLAIFKIKIPINNNF